MTVSPTEIIGLVLATKLLDFALASMSDPPTSVTCCLDSECTISAVESENGLLKPYLANRRAVVIGKFQEWKEKFPETDFEPLQQIAGPLNPADLPTISSCTALDVGRNTPWQIGPSFLKLPREEWPVTRDFKNEIPEDEVVKTIKAPAAKVCLLRMVPTCSCKTCSLLTDPCQC